MGRRSSDRRCVLERELSNQERTILKNEIVQNYRFKAKTCFSERFEERHGTEKRLPGLSMNPKQLFWMTAANVWCSKYRPKSLESRVRTGAHSPGMFRVKGPFSNSKEFAKDFNCPLGSTYNPVDKCEVW